MNHFLLQSLTALGRSNLFDFPGKFGRQIINVQGMNVSLLRTFSQKCVQNNTVIFNIAHRISQPLLQQEKIVAGKRCLCVVNKTLRNHMNQMVFRGITFFQNLHTEKGFFRFLKI